MATDHSNIFFSSCEFVFLVRIASLVFASLCIVYISICIDVSLHDFVCCFHDC
jgi:hypothetical protein